MSNVSEASSQTTVRVWREGNRIRTNDGTGYGDFVSDEQIRQHIAADLLSATKADAVAFAAAVLLHRTMERRVGLVAG